MEWHGGISGDMGARGGDQEDDEYVQDDGRGGEEDYHGNNLHSQVRTAGPGGEHAPPPEPGTSAATTNIMPQAYFQCRAARDASFQDKAVEISARSTLGIIEGGETARIGSFDRQDSSNSLCFSGSRVLRGG